MVSQAAAFLPAIVRPRSPQDAAPAVVAAPTVNLDETELELRYTMFAQHLDDEDLQITRTADGGAAVLLSGIVSSAERQRQLQAALGGIPGVRLSISLPNQGRRFSALPEWPRDARRGRKIGGASGASMLGETIAELISE